MAAGAPSVSTVSCDMTVRRIAIVAFALLGACQQRDEPMAGGMPLSHWKSEATKVSLFTFWNSDRDQRRRVAFQRLMEIGEPAVPALIDLMVDHGIPVRGDAFNALANLGPRAASGVPRLTRLLDDKNVQLRSYAAWILGSIGSAAEPAVPKITALLQDTSGHVREVAARALGEIKHAGVVSADVALAGAARDADPRLRELSVSGAYAARLPIAERRQQLAAALADTSAAVRLKAVELFQQANRKDVDSLSELLVRALDDADAVVRERAHGVVIGYVQHQVETPTLLAAVMRSHNAPARADAAWYLGSVNFGDIPRAPRAIGASGEGIAFGPAVSSALSAGLADADVKIRIYSARALMRGDDAARQRAIAALRRDIKSAEPILRVRGARMLWLAAHNVSDVKAAYEAGLADANEWNVVETISAILDMGREGRVFVPRVEQLLTHKSGEVRDRAEKFLYAMKRWQS